MPIWSEILAELNTTSPPDFDGVRRKYLLKLQKHTGRDVILYASGWLQSEAPPALVSIGEEDLHGLMEVTSGLRGPGVDVILHSPGGSPEAAEAIVSYLRARFSHIRVIIPQLAMSAATMIACAANEIVMGKHSFLGPTDPQLPLATALGMRLVPAQAILDQFDKAQHECADPAKLSAWLPMLSQYGPDLLVRCETALEMSRELVQTWLRTYRFGRAGDAEEKAESIANWLADHSNFKSHNRHLSRTDLTEQGLFVQNLEHDEQLQDASLSVFHATTHTFTGTSAVKIVENHLGRAFIKQYVQQSIHPFPMSVVPRPHPPSPT